MAVDAVRPANGAGLMTRMSTGIQNLPTLYRAIVAEMRRVTWPTREETRRMSLGVIALSLAIGAVIGIMDFVLTQVLVKWIPQIFAR
jgi:preprotein translocase SecE subunit